MMKKIHTQIFTLILSLIGVLALSGCGSSGTSSDHDLISGNTAVKSAPYEITAHHESTVVVHSHVTESTDEHVHTWTQVSGPTVGLSTTTAPTTSLVVPHNTTQPVVLQHTVTNVQTGQTTTSTHTVTPVPATPALSVTVSAHTSVVSGHTASLHASASGGDGQYSYIWTQTGGTTVKLDETHPSAPTFKAPSVSSAEHLKFEVQVIDGQADTASAVETVTVTPPQSSVVPLTATISGPDSVVQGDQIVLNVVAQGGSGNYTYRWLPFGTQTSTITIDSSLFRPSTLPFAVEVTDTVNGISETITVSKDVTIQDNPIVIKPISTQYVPHNVLKGTIITSISPIEVVGIAGETYSFEVKEITGQTPPLGNLRIASGGTNTAFVFFEKPDIYRTTKYTLQVTVKDSTGIQVGTLTFDVILQH